MVGTFDGDFDSGSQPGLSDESPLRLGFTPSGDSSKTLHDQRIRYLSVSRKHILASSESGDLWIWTSRLKPAALIDLSTANYRIKGESYDTLRMKNVFAGSMYNSAYAEHLGLLAWKTVKGQSSEPFQDSVLIKDDIAKDGSSIQKSNIVGSFLVVLTSSGRTFASEFMQNGSKICLSSPFEITPYDTTLCTKSSSILSSFDWLFIIRGGSLLIIRETDLISRQKSPTSEVQCLPHAQYIPALQQSGVRSIAFGKHHFHALHSDGTVSSYGTEPKSCGAFGFGGISHPDYSLGGYRTRCGIVTGGFSGSHFSDEVSKHDRTIRFDREHAERLAKAGESSRCGEDGRSARSTAESNPHFALMVAAGAYHSAAIIVELNA